VRAALLCGLALVAGCGSPAPEQTGWRWYRGNTHTHTLWSDGDSAPEAAIDWYAHQGYDFLVLSDHNILAEGDFWRRIGEGYKQARPEHVAELRRRFREGAVQVRAAAGGGEELRLHTLTELRAQFERPGRFLLITGEEISDLFEGAPIHHNALNIERTIAPPGGATVRELLRRTLELIAAEGRRSGRPVLGHLNHPNYEWGVSAEDLAAVQEERFFEVYNGHRLVRNEGDAEHRSSEAIWDYVLTLRLAQGGPPLYALATDDAHDFRQVPGTSNPGRGWVVVRAPALTADAIVAALAAGDFYASSGVRLRDVRADERSLTIDVDPQPGVDYTIRFIGTRRMAGPPEMLALGETLAESKGPSATYTLRGDELYVRGTVISSRRHPNGYSPDDLETAWVQPVIPAL
jgi:hypothetical protein